MIRVHRSIAGVHFVIDRDADLGIACANLPHADETWTIIGWGSILGHLAHGCFRYRDSLWSNAGVAYGGSIDLSCAFPSSVTFVAALKPAGMSPRRRSSEG